MLSDTEEMEQAMSSNTGLISEADRVHGASTAATTITATYVQTNIRFDPGYIKTIPGILRVTAIVSDVQQQQIY